MCLPLTKVLKRIKKKLSKIFKPRSKKTVKINKQLINIFFLIVSIFLTLVGIEIYLTKINYPHQNCDEVYMAAEAYLGKFDPEAGWSYKNYISYYDPGKKYEYHFNEDSIRVASPNQRINFDKPRILIIGGSVAFGEQLNFNETFAYRIGQLLDDRFEIVNIAVQGYGTDQSLKQLEKHIAGIDPQYIIYTFIPDHMARNVNYDRRLITKCITFNGTKPLYGLDAHGELKQIKQPKEYKLIDKFKLSLFINNIYQQHRSEKLIKNGGAEKITKKLVDEISKISQKHQAKDYYIYYDITPNESGLKWNQNLLAEIFENKSERVLNFVKIVEDFEAVRHKYFIPEEHGYHPSSFITDEIAEKFVEKFGQEFSQLNMN